MKLDKFLHSRHREKKTKKRGFIKSEIAESIGPKAIGGFGNIRFDKTVCNYFLPLSLLRKKYARLSNLANKYLLFKMFTEENNIILPMVTKSGWITSRAGLQTCSKRPSLRPAWLRRAGQTRGTQLWKAALLAVGEPIQLNFGLTLFSRAIGTPIADKAAVTSRSTLEISTQRLRSLIRIFWSQP